MLPKDRCQGSLPWSCQYVRSSLSGPISSKAWSTLIFEQIKTYLLDQLEEDERLERAKREVKKAVDIVAKASLLFDGFLSLLSTDHKALSLKQITKVREYATKAMAVWWIEELSLLLKCHASEDHACE
jgi:flagellin-specific chaperone FliS